MIPLSLLLGVPFLHDVLPHQKIRIRLSCEDTNRISVLNGRIAQVFGAGQQFLQEMDNTQGQIFLRPLIASAAGKPLTLILVMEEGFTQDLAVTVCRGEGYTHVLRLPAVVPEGVRDDRSSLNPIASVLALLKVVWRYEAQKREPNAYRSGSPPEPDSQQDFVLQDLSLRMAHRYTLVTPQGLARVFTITNPTASAITLEEARLAQDQDHGVWFSSRVLLPKAQAMVVKIALEHYPHAKPNPSTPQDILPLTTSPPLTTYRTPKKEVTP